MSFDYLIICDYFSHSNQQVEWEGLLIFTSNNLSVELCPCLCSFELCWFEGRGSDGTASIGDVGMTPLT